MRKRYSRSYTVLSFLTMFSYREQPFGRSFFIRQKKEVRKTIGTLVEWGISDVGAAGSLFGNSLRKADESPDGSALRRPLFKKMIPAVDLPFFLSGVIVY